MSPRPEFGAIPRLDLIDAPPSRHPHRYMDMHWRRFVRRADGLDGWRDLRYMSDFLECAGLYFLWGERDSLLYIGLSTGVGYRVAQHQWASTIPFTDFSWLAMEDDIDLMPHVELAYICALMPPFNNKFGPVTWAGHDRMAKLIRRLWRGVNVPTLRIKAAR